MRSTLKMAGRILNRFFFGMVTGCGPSLFLVAA